MENMLTLDAIQQTDPEIASAIRAEFIRQRDTLELIASENIASRAVMEAQGSVLTNKYAEGYPGKRYYGGCEYMDQTERLAIDRAKSLFKAEYANVQPHSGSQANMAVYFALLDPGDSILGMSLTHGGHLTHGSPASFSGRFFKFSHYGVNQTTGRIDYTEVERIARHVRPKMIVAGASAYPRIIDFDAFSNIARSVGAILMVDMAHIAGLVAAGLHPSPIQTADAVTSTTHKTLRGPRGGLILSRAIHKEKFDREIFPGIQGGPLMHVIAAKALAFKEALGDTFKAYQRRVVENAKALASGLLGEGVDLVSGGTDNHMLLLDLRSLNLTGKTAQEMLERAGITTNKNAIPFDPAGPAVTSGIRIGTPVVTTRGMGLSEMAHIADLIVRVLKKPGDDKTIQEIRKKSLDLCRAFPIYPELYPGEPN